MESKRDRRSAEEIVDRIFDALPANKHATIKDVARDAIVDWKTAKRYLALIWHIQEKQKGDWLQFMMVGDQPAYSRKGTQGRPKEE